MDGVRAPLLEAGPEGTPQAVVFFHGNPGACLDWEDLVARVGAFARAVAFDLPGFGQADKPRSFDYSVPGYSRFVEGALSRLGIDRAHLVLHDIGGWHGQLWAATHPDAFASVVLINTPPVVDYRWYLLAKVWRTPIAGELLQAAMNRPFFDLNVKRGRARPLPTPFIDRMWRDFDAGTRHAILKLYRATDVHRIVDAPVSIFHELARPALVIWGRRDPYIPVRFAEAHREIYPGLRYVYL
ncbi:MAG: alpha/beta hydrolase, partial [Candidatus Eisenbacteria bacterium]|nr:alpha/beta hydrolase [Candidatus Eisenbacteria bacterium]